MSVHVNITVVGMKATADGDASCIILCLYLGRPLNNNIHYVLTCIDKSKHKTAEAACYGCDKAFLEGVLALRALLDSDCKDGVCFLLNKRAHGCA